MPRYDKFFEGGTKTVGVVLEEDDLNFLREICRQERTGISTLIRRIVREERQRKESIAQERRPRELVGMR